MKSEIREIVLEHLWLEDAASLIQLHEDVTDFPTRSEYHDTDPCELGLAPTIPSTKGVVYESSRQWTERVPA